MNITVKNIDGVSVLTLEGNLLGESNAVPIQEIVVKAIENGNPNFTFELSGLKYINSTGLSILISTLTKSRKAGGELSLVNVPTQLENLLKITKLDSIFPISDTIESSMKKHNS